MIYNILHFHKELHLRSNELRIYPNPANNELRIINHELRENIDIQIFDIVGKLVLSHPSALSPETIIDISHLAKGMYFLKIGNKTAKFVKE